MLNQLYSTGTSALPGSRGSLDDMNSAIAAHNITQFTHLQSECSILERLLHLSTTERPQVATIAGRATVRLRGRQCGKVLSSHYPLPQSLQLCYGSLLRATTDVSALWVLPARGTGEQQRGGVGQEVSAMPVQGLFMLDWLYAEC